MCNCRPKLRGEVLRAFWDAHFAAWLDSDLNQREYCEAQGLSLRQFGNWRAELKYEEHVTARRALWRRNGLCMVHFLVKLYATGERTQRLAHMQQARKL